MAAMTMRDRLRHLPQGEPDNADDTATRRIEAVIESLRAQRLDKRRRLGQSLVPQPAQRVCGRDACPDKR